MHLQQIISCQVALSANFNPFGPPVPSCMWQHRSALTQIGQPLHTLTIINGMEVILDRTSLNTNQNEEGDHNLCVFEDQTCLDTKESEDDY